MANDLLDKREKTHEVVNKHREQRDRLNDNTRNHSARRDELNAQVRGFVEQANAHRAKRDELNAKVREGKQKRDELNRLAHEKSHALQELRQAQGATEGPPLARLKAELRRLEFEHQTKALTPKKEKALIELMAAKQKEIKDREAEYKEPGELQTAYDEMKAAKAAAEEQHKAVTEIAQSAQGEHEAMIKLFGQADALRKDADAAQAQFVASKTAADKEHRAYIEAIHAIKDIDRVVAHLRPTAASPETSTRGDQARADEIFDKFRKGEKLSTEDLMMLQKAGRL